MVLMLRDLLMTKEYLDFVRLFVREHNPSSHKHICLGFLCTSTKSYSTITAYFTENHDKKHFIMVDSTEIDNSYSVDLLYIFSDNVDRITDYLEEDLKFLSSVDPLALVTYQDFFSHLAPSLELSGAINFLVDLGQTVNKLNSIGDLNHPKLPEDEIIYDFFSPDNHCADPLIEDRFLFQSELSVNRVGLTLAIKQTISLNKIAPENLQAYFPEWNAGQRTDRFLELFRVSKSDNIDEALFFTLPTIEHDELVGGFKARHVAELLRRSPNLLNVLRNKFPVIRIDFLANQKHEISPFSSLANERIEHILAFLDHHLTELISLDLSFSRK